MLCILTEKLLERIDCQVASSYRGNKYYLIKFRLSLTKKYLQVVKYYSFIAYKLTK